MISYSVIFNFTTKDNFENDLIITISNITAENKSIACTIAINEFIKSHFPHSYYEAYKNIEKIYIEDESIYKNNSFWNPEYIPSFDSDKEELEWHEFTSEECLKCADNHSFSNIINKILESLPSTRNVEKKNPQQSQFIALLVRRNISIQKIMKTFLTRIDLEIVSGIHINLR